MIRHSSFFLISVLLHTFLLFVVFLVYKAMVKKQEIKQKKEPICVKLCTMNEKKVQITKTVPKKKEIK